MDAAAKGAAAAAPHSVHVGLKAVQPAWSKPGSNRVTPGLVRTQCQHKRMPACAHTHSAQVCALLQNSLLLVLPERLALRGCQPRRLCG